MEGKTTDYINNINSGSIPFRCLSKPCILYETKYRIPGLWNLYIYHNADVITFIIYNFSYFDVSSAETISHWFKKKKKHSLDQLSYKMLNVVFGGFQANASNLKKLPWMLT